MRIFHSKLLKFPVLASRNQVKMYIKIQMESLWYLVCFFDLADLPYVRNNHSETDKRLTEAACTRFTHGTLENHHFSKMRCKFSKAIQLATLQLVSLYRGVSQQLQLELLLPWQRDKAIKSNSLNHRENGGKTLGMGAP